MQFIGISGKIEKVQSDMVDHNISIAEIEETKIIGQIQPTTEGKVFESSDTTETW